MFKTPNQDQIGIHFPCEILKNEVSLNLSFAKSHSDNKVMRLLTIVYETHILDYIIIKCLNI